MFYEKEKMHIYHIICLTKSYIISYEKYHSYFNEKIFHILTEKGKNIFCMSYYNRKMFHTLTKKIKNAYLPYSLSYQILYNKI